MHVLRDQWRQKVSAGSMLPPSKGRLIGSRSRKRGKRRTSSSLEPCGSKASAGTLPHSKLRSMKGFILVGRAGRNRNLGFRSSERKLPSRLSKAIPGSDRHLLRHSGACFLLPGKVFGARSFKSFLAAGPDASTEDAGGRRAR